MAGSIYDQYPQLSGLEGAGAPVINPPVASSPGPNPVSQFMQRVSNPSLYAQQQQAVPNFLPPAESARETAGFAGKLATAESGGGGLTAALPSGPTGRQFQDDAGFGFRNAIAAARLKPVVPGSQLRMQYSPANGGANVTATAGANGRFNQFTGVPGGTPGGTNVPGIGDVSGVNAALLQQHTNLSNRIATLESSGNPLAGLILKGLYARQAQMQSQIAQQQQIALTGRQVGVQEAGEQRQEQVARPGIIKGNIEAGLLQQGPAGISGVRKINAASQGRTDTTQVQTPFSTYVAPNDALAGGAIFSGYPGVTPTMPMPYYQVQPQQRLSDNGLPL